MIMRSNGQPVYNFCVTVDDATMRISRVIRAEEHLPNTLRQALIYKALGFPMPLFAHVSLILAPDKSKLSERHGATSVGQHKEMGYLPQAMVNYLALLGWGDGTENEFVTINDLVEKFTIKHVNKSGAVFDATKLNIFAQEAAELLKDGIDLITDADAALSDLLSYPLQATLSSDEAKPVVQDRLSEVSSGLISAYGSGELCQALAEGRDGWQKWVKFFGKSLNRKGKSLLMPLRVLLTGKLHGPDMGGTIVLVHKAGICGAVSPQSGFVNLDNRFRILKEIDWESLQKEQESPAESAVSAAS